MTDLLESVQTDRLKSQFDKYIPSVIAGDTPAKDTKATLTEGTEVTGNKENNDIDAGSSNTDNVIDIRRLAGLNQGEKHVRTTRKSLAGYENCTSRRPRRQ